MKSFIQGSAPAHRFPIFVCFGLMLIYLFLSARIRNGHPR
jgi:hypothetical protein